MKSKLLVAAGIAVAITLGLILGISSAPSASLAAPAAAPTPVAAAKAGSGVMPTLVTLLDEVATVDDVTGPCVYVADYEKADIYYEVAIDNNNVNTTTLTLKHGNVTNKLVSGLNVAATVAANTTGMNQFALYGAYLCVTIDATDASTGTVTVSANALLK